MSHGFEVTECKACHARMFFAPSEKGKQIPLCEAPVHNGNIFLRDGVAVYVSKHNPAPKDAVRYVSHFSNCTNPGQFRSKKESDG